MRYDEPIRIDDPDDPRVAFYRDIRERDLAGREGLFIAEGKVVLNVLFKARRFEVESALLLENRVAGMRETLALAPEGRPVYVAGREVIDRIAGFHLHRGILALGRRRSDHNLLSMIRSLPPKALVIALIGISNHDNVGAIFRNAAAFGVAAIILDDTCCDPLYRKAIRVSVGAALKVPFVRAGNADEIVKALDGADFQTLALSPSAHKDIVDIAATPRTALIFGTEGEGLPSSLLLKMKTARIGMEADFDSLNVAAASAVALHSIWRQSATR